MKYYFVYAGSSKYTFEDTIQDEGVGTLVKEATTVIAPRAMWGFINKTTIHYHTEMLSNLKMILEEGWYESDVR